MHALLLSTTLLLPTAPPVSAVAYAPNGSVLAAGVDRQVALIDPKTGDVTRWIDVPQRVTALAFFPDSKTLAVAVSQAAKSGDVRIFALDQPSTQPRIIHAHKDAVYGLATDGKQLATGSYDNLVKLWDAKTGSELFTLKDHSDAVYGVARQPGGQLLASVAADRAVKVWDTASGKRLYSLTDATDWLHAVAISPDAKRLAAAGIDKSIRIWDVNAQEGKLIAAFFAHEGPVIGLAFAPNGKSIYSLSTDRTIKVWDPETKQERRQFDRLPAEPTSFALSPDGKRVAVARHDGVMVIYDAITGKVVATPLPEVPKPPKIIAIEPAALPRNVTMHALLRGTRLDAVTAVHSATAGVEAAVVRRTPTELELRVTIARTVPPGPVALIARSAAGDAAPVELHVDAFPFLSASISNDVAFDRTIVGKLDRAGAVASHRLNLNWGQEVGAVVTKPNGSKLTPVLAWTDSAGNALAEGAAAGGFTAPHTGTFVLTLHDREYRGGANYEYRLHVGRLPVVTGVLPLTVARGETREIRLSGVFLAETKVNVSAPADAVLNSKLPVPAQSADGPVAGSPTVTVVELPAVRATTAPYNSTLISVPGAGEGDMRGGSATWTFTAKKGQLLIIEALARRYGSPLDPTLEILTQDGQPIERARLRCVAKTVTVLRDHPADSSVLRLEAWNEFQAEDYVWVGNEVMKISQLPGHPDADCDFYSVNDKKQTFFDTTASWHPLGASVFKVQVYPPGTKLAPNGFPIVPLYFRNDDGGPGYDKDSRVMFDPPADGTYLARITDARGQFGGRYSYRIVIRPPQPSFTIRAAPNAPTVERGGAKSISVTVDRFDGFDGPVEVFLKGLTPGFTCPPTRVENGHTKAVLSLAATVDAKPVEPGRRIAPDNPFANSELKLLDAGELIVTGSAVIDGATISKYARLGLPKLVGPGDIITRVEQPNVIIRPGMESKLEMCIERRNGFTGRVPVEVRGLPHGVRVLNIGLNAIMITEKETSRVIPLYAEPWVKPTSMPILVVAKREGPNSEHAAPPLPIIVEK